MIRILTLFFFTILSPLAQADSSKNDGPKASSRFSVKMHSLLLKGQYEELVKTATKLREDKTTFDDGKWKLTAFYFGVATPAKTWQDEKLWDSQIKNLQEWIDAYPNSITAKIALAECYVQYGKHARGGGFANTVAEDNWKLFAERVKKAENLLKEAKKIEGDCPQYHETLLTIGLYQGWSRKNFDLAFNKAVKEWPDYSEIYLPKLWYVLPRYYGEPDEVFAYAKQILDTAPKEYGVILYALMGNRIYPYYLEDFFSDGKYSWQLMKQGFEGLERKYPNSNYNRNLFAINAFYAGDRKTAKALLERIESPDMSVWRKRGAYRYTRKWAGIQDTPKSNGKAKEE